MTCSPTRTAYPGSVHTHRSNPALPPARQFPRNCSHCGASHRQSRAGRPYTRESPPSWRTARWARVCAFPSTVGTSLHRYVVFPGHIDVGSQRFGRVFVEKQHIAVIRPHSASSRAFHSSYGSFRLAASVWLRRKQCWPKAFEKAFRNVLRWSSEASNDASKSNSSVIRPC